MQISTTAQSNALSQPTAGLEHYNLTIFLMDQYNGRLHNAHCCPVGSAACKSTCVQMCQISNTHVLSDSALADNHLEAGRSAHLRTSEVVFGSDIHIITFSRKWDFWSFEKARIRSPACSPASRVATALLCRTVAACRCKGAALLTQLAVHCQGDSRWYDVTRNDAMQSAAEETARKCSRRALQLRFREAGVDGGPAGSYSLCATSPPCAHPPPVHKNRDIMKSTSGKVSRDARIVVASEIRIYMNAQQHIQHIERRWWSHVRHVESLPAPH